MENIQWVVQQNLTSREDLISLQNTCEKIDVDFVGVYIIPFSNEVPVFDRNKRSIF
jgi:hypothetical protein